VLPGHKVSDATSPAARPERRTTVQRPILSALSAWERRARGMVSVRLVGAIVLLGQLIALLVYSSVEYARFALSIDFAPFSQASFLIAQGNLNPFDTLQGIPFWQNHLELMMWPLALLYFIYPHTITLLWFQDVVTVGGELVAFLWIVDLLQERPAHVRAWLAACALVVLVGNPWTYWANAFDFHFVALGTLLILLAARALYRMQLRQAYLYVALTILTGDVQATYVAGLGVCAVLAGGSWRRHGIALIAAGAVWVLVFHLVGGDKGTSLSLTYGYLAGSHSGSLSLVQLIEGILRHPSNIPTTLWERRANLYSHIAASGFIGLVSPWAVGVVAVVLLANTLAAALEFSTVSAGFQGLPAHRFLTVGTFEMLGRLSSARPRLACGLAALVAANTLGWAVVWIPQVPVAYLRVSPAAASELARVESLVPAGAEVFASQGVVGRFAGRRWVYAFSSNGFSVPVHGLVYVILTPSQGIESASVSSQIAALRFVARLPGSRPVSKNAGVWAFRWQPRPGTRALTFSARERALSAWGLNTDVGVPLTEGPVRTWRMAATGQAGYVVYGDYWRAPPGIYRAVVHLATSGAGVVEVWNATGNQLLARRTIPATDGPTTVVTTVVNRRRYPEHAFAGIGPFTSLPIAPSRNNALEVRVWTSRGSIVEVYSIALQRLSSLSHGNGRRAILW
jgi:Predicted membrane protein (DUF2079)